MLTMKKLGEAMAELEDAKEAKFAAEKEYNQAVQDIECLAANIHELFRLSNSNNTH